MSKKPNLPLPAAYVVGYGKPPVKNRFTKGVSGNPKGRPKGKRKKSMNEAPHHEKLKDIILAEAYRSVPVNDGSAKLTVPMAQAVMRSLAVTAAKGNTRAQKIFTELVSTTELSQKKVHDDWLQIAIQYKRDWECELERRKLSGITIHPDPLPHPDDVVIDYNRETVTFRGPIDKEELAELDLWLTRKHDNEAELQYTEREYARSRSARDRRILQSDIGREKRILEIINTVLATRASRSCIERRLSQLNLKTPDYLVKLEAMELSE